MTKRKVSEASARAFCLPLLARNRPLKIRRDPESSGLRVSFIRPRTRCVCPNRFREVVSGRGEITVHSATADLIEFGAPAGFPFDEIYQLIHKARVNKDAEH